MESTNSKFVLSEDKRVSGPHVGRVVSLHDLNSCHPYGFLKSDQSKHDIYFAFADIESGTARRLRNGHNVEFILYRISEDERRGLRAKVKYVTRHTTASRCRNKWSRSSSSTDRNKAVAVRIAKGPDETGGGKGFQLVRTVPANVK